MTLSISNPNITVSGAGYETATYTISSSTTSLFLPVSRTLSSQEVKVAAIWPDSSFDVDLNLFGPGNVTLYDAATAGVVNWEYIDKTAGLPFGRWTEKSSNFGAETIEISELSRTDNYEFMVFDWSRVGLNDPSAEFAKLNLYVYIWGGSSTGIRNSAFRASPPTPPSGFAYVFWQPFILQNTGSSLHTLLVTNSFNPAISQSSISNSDPLFYSCIQTFCPYSIPGI